MATRLRVNYLDGRTVEVIATPRAQIATEEHLGGINPANRLRASYYLSWASLSKAGKEPNDYEKWLDLVDDVNEVEPTEEDLSDEDPTQTDQLSDTSSD